MAILGRTVVFMIAVSNPVIIDDLVVDILDNETIGSSIVRQRIDELVTNFDRWQQRSAVLCNEPPLEIFVMLTEEVEVVSHRLSPNFLEFTDLLCITSIICRRAAISSALFLVANTVNHNPTVVRSTRQLACHLRFRKKC